MKCERDDLTHQNKRNEKFGAKTEEEEAMKETPGD